ncbi:TPA: proline--tRNA ligase [Candidatus Woesearchaeota archaeon]|nr:proline--tRNA ligase [Candidatus Woesearchaeota archaeon]HIH32613.1 proline--tRNA ligase [Candidatus Woesearchaeota archaeon]HIH54838.1 proline--tRNA ligase [Candidatus Woesearchaeota archaeon]HIJ01615.1 proline--tRNA ligase [Candidatus Woesearchaeota archaeon]HIJ13712.1 proline--tRNA ligase [Candidatus Woesearchaeota archaeon]
MADNSDDGNDRNDEPKDIGVTVKKSEDFSEWYQQIILKSEMIEYGPVSGCMIIRPYAYSIWEKIQNFTNREIKSMGIQNAYFPMLIPESLFNKEKEHVKGFSPEVAWVTQGGNSELPERLAIRPTSETIMYDSYSKWIRSWRDLPLRLNQWCNIVRWEFKHPIPFLRTREFLWQEGHTAFATKQEAEKEVFEILDLYRRIFEDLYAVPMLTGIKSENEKFAGALYTTSVETLFPNGKAIQGATSHLLGQNFSKLFNISFLDAEGNKQYVWQNSWGITTRTIGIMIGVHGDDKGLLIPPRVAPIHIAIIPILFEDSMDKVLRKCFEIKEGLSKTRYHEDHLNAIVDDSDDRPGYKFNHWELKGVPLRIELGPKDLEKHQAVLVRRDTGEKTIVKISEINEISKELLDDIQKNLYERSLKILNDSISKTDNLDDFKKLIEEKKTVLVPFCNNPECEDNIKAMTGAKSLNSPLDQKNNEMKCFSCNALTKTLFYFGRSY